MKLRLKVGLVGVYQIYIRPLVGEFPSNIQEIPGFFELLEKQFIINNVNNDIKARILQSCLTCKARSLITRLSPTQLKNYDNVKTALLAEYRVSPAYLKQ